MKTNQARISGALSVKPAAAGIGSESFKAESFEQESLASAGLSAPASLRLPRLARLLGPLLLAILAAGAVFSPSSAQAQCDCGSISSIVREAAERIITGIARPLDAAIRQAASYETQNLHLDLVALREAIILSQESITAAIRSADKSAAERELERTFDTPSRPPTQCGDDQMGGALLGGTRTSAKTGEAIMDKLIERKSRFEWPVDYLREMGEFPEPAQSASTIGALSSGRTLTLEELKGAERTIEALSDPFPPPSLPEASRESSAGKIYETRKWDYETRQILYQSVLARRVSDLAPVIEDLAEWAGEKWAQMGGEGSPPGLVEGKMSKEALFWLLGNMRLSSANWHERILPSLTEAGLLREMASIMAVDLEITRRIEERLGEMSMMMAFDGLRSLEAGAGEAMRLQYRRALGQAE